MGPDGAPGDDGSQHALIIQSLDAFRRRRYHRAKAHLILSAMRHRVAELGARAEFVEARSFRSALEGRAGTLSVCAPTSWQGRRAAEAARAAVLPARGFVTTQAEFASWSEGRRRLLLEDFYRDARKRTGILMRGDEPAGGRWNFDADNRLPPPKGESHLALPEPWRPTEDAIDDEVRDLMARWERDEGIEFGGADGPRLFAATRAEALAALDDFVDHRLGLFGPYEDASLAGDWVMAHSLLSAPLNLGLLHPREVIDRALLAYESGTAPLPSVEGLVRQILGWRDFVWHLYWHFGEDYVRDSNALSAHEPLPGWFRELDDEAVQARCLGTALKDVRARGWNHHITRLMVLGNWALQRGYDPQEMTEWFTANYVDAYPWVMAVNSVGMALYADGGRMATKPYAAGGAYINRMSDYCKGCRYKPGVRVGPTGCPFTAGYWWFLDRNSQRLAGNARIAQPLRGLERLADRDDVVAQESARGEAPP